MTDIALIDASTLKIFAVSFMRQETAGTGDPACLGNGVGEVQVLKAVQGIVVHEVTDRGLAGQYVLQVLDSLEQLFADVHFLTVGSGRAHDR